MQERVLLSSDQDQVPFLVVCLRLVAALFTSDCNKHMPWDLMRACLAASSEAIPGQHDDDANI